MNEMIWFAIGFAITLVVLITADLILEIRTARK